MQTQAVISREKPESKAGKRLAILVDEAHKPRAVGRRYADAPEIEGLLYLESAADVHVGDIRKVLMLGNNDHDLQGQL